MRSWAHGACGSLSKSRGAALILHRMVGVSRCFQPCIHTFTWYRVLVDVYVDQFLFYTEVISACFSLSFGFKTFSYIWITIYFFFSLCLLLYHFLCHFCNKKREFFLIYWFKYPLHAWLAYIYSFTLCWFDRIDDLSFFPHTRAWSTTRCARITCSHWWELVVQNVWATRTYALFLCGWGGWDMHDEAGSTISTKFTDGVGSTFGAK